MQAESRTAKSIRNSTVALLMYAVNLVLQFYSRKIFLEYLGTEILGLNTTATNLLQFLNLAELGVGSAIAFSLYRPLSDGDQQAINEIVSFQGKIYRRIATFIIIGAVILSLFFPWIFSKMELPLWYAYASFGVLLFSALLGYYVNYKQVLLTADQQDYKVQYTYRLSMILKVLFQMVAMWWFTDGYVWWLILEVVFTFVGSISLWYIVHKTYPYLTEISLTFKELLSRYPEILKKVKQLFFHKISSFALFQLSPLIVYLYANLTLVTIYGNYVLIMNGLITLAAAIFNSVTSGIGNMLNQSPERSFDFFSELFSLRFYIATVGSVLFMLLVDDFIRLWIGSEYILPNLTLILMTVTLFVSLFRQVLDNYLSAYGLFQDVWAPVAEMLLNLGFSLWLGYYYGLNGILVGMIISVMCIVMVWKPYFLFTKGIMKSVWTYWRLFFMHVIQAIVCIAVGIFAIRYITFSVTSYSILIIKATICATVFGGLLLLSLNLTKTGIISFERRILSLIKSKF